MKQKRFFKIIGRNILRPHKIINAIGNRFVNPMQNNKMFFQPFTIDIEPNTRCNLSCIFCQVPGWDRSQIKDLDFQGFQEIIKRFPFLLQVKIQGMGEPFLNKDIFKMIEYANSKGIECHINTNGTTLNEDEIKRLFENPLLTLSFSLDSPDRETYKKIRGKDMFDKVVENIIMAIKERDRCQSNTEINIWCVLNRYNLSQMLKLVELAGSIRVDSLIIQPSLISFGRDDIRAKNDAIRVNPADEESKKMLKEAGDLSKKIGLNFVIYTHNYFSKEKPCRGPKNSAYVSVEGEVLPCCLLGDPRIASIGNIYQVDNFSKIWNNDKYQKWRAAINKNRLTSFCKMCYAEDKRQ